MVRPAIELWSLKVATPTMDRLKASALLAALFVVVPTNTDAFANARAHQADNAAPAADSGFGLGGYSEMAENAVIPFIAQQSGRFTTAMTVINVGKVDMEIEMVPSVPFGITVEVGTQVPFTLRKGESSRVPFTIVSSPKLAVGDYDGTVTLQPRIDNKTPGMNILPGISASFGIKVTGTSSKVTVKSVNSNDNSPARGMLSLYYVDSDGTRTLLEQKDGAELNRVVSPGKYRADFEIRGLTNRTEEFEIVSGETKSVTIAIEGLTFESASARPVGDKSDVNAVNLRVAVRNNLTRFKGPVRFNAIVTRDGKLVETYDLANLAELPEGLTEQKSSYVPDSGFSPGTWRFEFSVATPSYEVKGPRAEEFVVPPRQKMLWVYFWFGMAFLMGLLGATVRRRERWLRSWPR